MATDPTEEGNEAGSTLRSKLEHQLEENKALKAQLAPLLAANEIATKGYKFVKPEDLSGVDPTELAAKAAALEDANRKVHADVLRSVLADQGVPEAELDAAVESHLNPDQREDHAVVSGRLASLGRVTGSIPETDKDRGLTGQDRIAAALNEKYAKNTRR